MNKAEELRKLLDNGWTIRLFKSRLGSYTAQAGVGDDVDEFTTDDFTIEKLLVRITEKVMGEGDFGERSSEDDS